jgi:hypothetical protein
MSSNSHSISGDQMPSRSITFIRLPNNQRDETTATYPSVATANSKAALDSTPTSPFGRTEPSTAGSSAGFRSPSFGGQLDSKQNQQQSSRSMKKKSGGGSGSRDARANMLARTRRSIGIAIFAFTLFPLCFAAICVTAIVIRKYVGFYF